MKIVIVGGGTAGWIAACYYARFNQDLKNEIVVIESSKIPTIGAGEGSTGIFTKIVNSHFTKLGINEIDFLNKTKSTLKLGIRFKDWSGDGKEFLSPVQPTETGMSSIDVHLLVSHILGDYADSSPSGYLMDNDYSTYSKSGSTIMGHSYHFDAQKVGEYFKEYAMKAGVTYVDTEVTSLNINKDNGELDSIESTIGNISADFWVDCSGMARVLINPMGGGWKSYEEYLPTNSAIPYIHQYEVGETPKLETLSWAMPNGWMWQIPTQERYGCGYVYSDKFITDEQALEEVQRITGRKIEPVRVISFDPGKQERVWINNVMAVGLSSNFLEPMEATSIHSTIMQLEIFTTIYLGIDSYETIFETNINKYNLAFSKIFDSYRDLIQIHYITKREDSDFWKWVKNEMPKTDKVKEIIEICKYKCPSPFDFDNIIGAAGWGTWSNVVSGLGILQKRIAFNTLWGNDLHNDSEQNFDKMMHHYYKHTKNFITHNEFIKFIKTEKNK